MIQPGFSFGSTVRVTTPPYDGEMKEIPVDVVRSARRKRTIQGSVVDGRVRVLVPAGLPADEERRMVASMVEKLSRKRRAGVIDLEDRGRLLARRYGLPVARSIEWSSRQGQRWASCTPVDGTVRISNRLAAMPDWVIDYVLIHELAHLASHGHTERFKTMVARYQLAERAEGYLLAKSEEGVFD